MPRKSPWMTIKIRRTTLDQIIHHLSNHPLKPEQQNFISDLLELALKVKHISFSKINLLSEDKSV